MQTWPEGGLTWPGVPPLLGWADSRNAREVCPCLHTNKCVCFCVRAHTHTYIHSEKSAWKALDSHGALGPRGRTYKRYKCSQELLHPTGPAGKEGKVAADIGSLPSGSSPGCPSCGRERRGKESLGRGQPPLPTLRAPDGMPSSPVQLHGDRAGCCPHPYLAHTGWRGPSSECLQSWSPHTRTCLGPTPRCSQSARHLRGHSNRDQAWIMGSGLHGIWACVDQRLKMSGPHLGTSVASRKLSLMSPRPHGWKQALQSGAQTACPNPCSFVELVGWARVSIPSPPQLHGVSSPGLPILEPTGQ